MKKLPKVYQNTIDKKIKNNKEVTYIRGNMSDDVFNNNCDVSHELDSIFSGFGYAFNIPVTIKTDSKVYETSLVTRTNNNVVTLDNDVIPINKINYIKRKNP